MLCWLKSRLRHHLVYTSTANPAARHAAHETRTADFAIGLAVACVSSDRSSCILHGFAVVPQIPPFLMMLQIYDSRLLDMRQPGRRDSISLLMYIWKYPAIPPLHPSLRSGIADFTDRSNLPARP